MDPHHGAQKWCTNIHKMSHVTTFGIYHWQNKMLESPPRRTLRRIWKIAPPHQSALALGNISRYVQKSQISKFYFVCAVMGVSWKSNMLIDLDRTQCHVWLVNIAKSMWQWLSKCVFVPQSCLLLLAKFHVFLGSWLQIYTRCH